MTAGERAHRLPAEILTQDQKTLVELGFGLVAAAARRLEPRSRGLLGARDLEGLGHEGLVDAAQRYNAELGVPFEIYARFRIEWAMLEGVRREAKQTRIALAVRASSRRALAVQTDPSDAMRDTDEDTALQLTRIADGLLSGMLAAAVAEADRLAGEEGIIAREEHANAIHALAEARAGLPARDQSLLQLHYAEDKDLKEVATALGVSYATVRRYHAGVIGRLAVRLRSAGVEAAPAK